MLLFYLLFKSLLKVHRNKEKRILGVKAQPRRPAQPRSLPACPGALEDCRCFPRAEGGGEDPLVRGQLSPGPHCSQKGTASVGAEGISWTQLGKEGRSHGQVLGGAGDSGPEGAVTPSPGLRREQGGTGLGEASRCPTVSSENAGSSLGVLRCAHTLTPHEQKL